MLAGWMDGWMGHWNHACLRDFGGGNDGGGVGAFLIIQKMIWVVGIVDYIERGRG